MRGGPVGTVVARGAGGLCLAATLSGCLLGAHDPGVFLEVTNTTASPVVLRYIQSAGDRDFIVPASSTGRPELPFPAPEPDNRVVVLDLACRELATADVPEAGIFLVTILDGSVLVDVLADADRDRDAAILEPAAQCREGDQ